MQDITGEARNLEGQNHYAPEGGYVLTERGWEKAKYIEFQKPNFIVRVLLWLVNLFRRLKYIHDQD